MHNEILNPVQSLFSNQRSADSKSSLENSNIRLQVSLCVDHFNHRVMRFLTTLISGQSGALMFGGTGAGNANPQRNAPCTVQ